HDGLAQPGYHQEADEQALQHDQAHRVVPAHQGGDLEGDDGVQAQSGGERERQIAPDPHDDGHHGGHQGGGGGELHGVELLAELVLGAAQDEGVEHQDVGHGEERGETAAYLPGEGGSPGGDPEEPVEGVAAVRPLVRVGRGDGGCG